MNEDFVTKISENLSTKYLKEYQPPRFVVKDLDRTSKVRCKLRHQDNIDTFDENFKGFAAILSAVVEM